MGEVHVLQDGAVTRLVLDHPGKKNAIDTSMWEGLQAALAHVAHDESVRALVLEGANVDFSAGADISAGSPPTHSHVVRRLQWINEVVLALHRTRVPTIAKVDGIAVGVGMNLALACDLVVAADRARFGEIFVRRALTVDGGGSWLLPRLIGPARAKELCFFGDLVDAPRALELGLVNRVVPAEDLEDLAADWAHRLAAGPALALGSAKRLLTDGLTRDFEPSLEAEAAAQAINIADADFGEAVAAFREKRPPAFA